MRINEVYEMEFEIRGTDVAELRNRALAKLEQFNNGPIHGQVATAVPGLHFTNFDRLVFTDVHQILTTHAGTVWRATCRATLTATTDYGP